MKNSTLENIIKQIDKGEKKSPFLFLGKNTEILNSNIENLALDLLKKYEIPKTYLYKFENNGEKIKIKDIKSFVEYSNSKPPYKFQIFFIEDISRFTISAGNSLLKFFEEPDVTNIIFLTNNSESGVLDTILSRVQTFDMGLNKVIEKDSFYQSLIKNYIEKKEPEILNYFFKNKLEKKDYISFLENLIIYIKENLILLEFAEKIDEDINAIKQNNVNAKYIVDKWLLKI